MALGESSFAVPGASKSWPVIEGTYIVGDPQSPVAVCVLTSDDLLTTLASVRGVAIVGKVQTANIGIKHIILNIIANPAIRFLLLCGKESPLFKVGQSLKALFETGLDANQRISGAQGYDPFLRDLSPYQIQTFRHQVELVDWINEKDVDLLKERIHSLAQRNPGPFFSSESMNNIPLLEIHTAPQFRIIRPGGQRSPLLYDPKGYFVISLDRAAGLIILRHYLPDHTPAHEMRGRTAESMLLGLLREKLISQMSHAGYLGAELAKAETALRLGRHVHYEQDRLVRLDMPTSVPSAPEAAVSSTTVTETQWLNRAIGDFIDVGFIVTAQPAEHELEGDFLEPGKQDALRTFYRTDCPLTIHWSTETQVVMGKPQHFVPGALLRVKGVLQDQDSISAQLIAVMTNVVSLLKR